MQQTEPKLEWRDWCVTVLTVEGSDLEKLNLSSEPQMVYVL